MRKFFEAVYAKLRNRMRMILALLFGGCLLAAGVFFWPVMAPYVMPALIQLVLLVDPFVPLIVALVSVAIEILLYVGISAAIMAISMALVPKITTWVDRFFSSSIYKKSNVDLHHTLSEDELLAACSKKIGGYRKTVKTLIRELVSVRHSELAKTFGVKPTKGFVLYGAAGTGKTTIARTVAEFFGNVAVVEASTLADKFVGETEKNIRRLFEEPKRNPSKLYFLIIDEIDAMFSRRGQGGADSEHSKYHDGVVAQLLTMLDGVDSPKNLIVIGTSNRKDVLDEALIRPGRLTPIAVGLPNTTERLAILKQKVQVLQENKKLDGAMDLERIAQDTEGYSGAALEQLVNQAAVLAWKKQRKTADPVMVTPHLFCKAKENLQVPGELPESVKHMYV